MYLGFAETVEVAARMHREPSSWIRPLAGDSVMCMGSVLAGDRSDLSVSAEGSVVVSMVAPRELLPKVKRPKTSCEFGRASSEETSIWWQSECST